MTYVDWILVSGQLVLVGVAALAWRWLKELPAALHHHQQQMLQHELNRELEGFKTSLSRDLELLKISHAEIQVRKTEEFKAFANLHREFLTDKSLLAKLNAGDTATVGTLQKQVLDLATGLFFFASDETVRQYGEWKVGTQTGRLQGAAVLGEFGAVMVALRRDLGQRETTLEGRDYLRLFVNDWDDYDS